MNPVVDIAVVSFILVAGLAACGGGGSSSTAPAADSEVSAFVGTWTYQSGATLSVSAPGFAEAGVPQDADVACPPGVTAPCNNAGQAETHAIMGRFDLEPGKGGTLVMKGSMLGQCTWSYSVSGRVATATADQSCLDAPVGDGGTVELVLLQSTLTLSDDGAALTENTKEQGYGIATFTASGTLKR